MHDKLNNGENVQIGDSISAEEKLGTLNPNPYVIVGHNGSKPRDKLKFTKIGQMIILMENFI